MTAADPARVRQAEMRTAVGVVELVAGVGVDVLPGLAHQCANVGETDVVFLVTSTPTTRGDRRPAAELLRFVDVWLGGRADTRALAEHAD